MVHSTGSHRSDLPLERVASYLDGQKTGTRVDLFGGEPTLHPDFWKIVEKVSAEGYTLSVASNARFFSRPGRAERLMDLTRGAVYVRTSLYGSTPTRYEQATKAKGGFEEFLAGVTNLVKAGASVQANIVLTRSALAELEESIDLVARLGISRIKFSGLVRVDDHSDVEPSLGEVRGALQQAIFHARSAGLIVTIEKLPVCVAPGSLPSFSTERDLAGWPRVYGGQTTCNGCLARGVCDGLDPGYAGRHGTDELVRLDALPASAVRPLPLTLEEFDRMGILKTHVFRIPDDWQTNIEVQERCAKAITFIKERLGRVAFITDSLIRN